MSKFNYSVKVFPFNSTSKVRAFASLIIEDILEVKNFKVVEGANGLFVGTPNRPGQKDGKTEYFDDVIFLDRDPEKKEKSEFFKEIEQAIIEEYKKKTFSNSRGNAAKANTKAPKPSGKKPESGPFGEAPTDFDDVPF